MNVNTEIKALFSVETDGNTKKSKAKCSLCSSMIAPKSFNRKRHLETRHKEAFLEIKKKCEDNIESAERSVLNTKKVHQVWSVLSFKNYIIKSIVMAGMPLSHFMEKEFSEFYEGIASELNVSLHRHNIKRIIMERYEDRKKDLIKVLKGRHVFLKVDHTKRNNRRFIGLNCQLLDEKLNKIVVYTLGVVKVCTSQTGTFVKDFIRQKMSEFEIEERHVLAIISDSARNLILATHLISEEFEQSFSSSDNFYVQHENDEEVESAIENRLGSRVSDFVMQHVKCASHLFQNCLQEALLESEAILWIELSKRLSKAARQTNTAEALESIGCLRARAEHNVRWVNNLDILERVVKSKSHYQSLHDRFPQLYASSEDWEKMEEFLTVLYPAGRLTKNLQEENLTPGKFYFDWSSLIITLENLLLQQNDSSSRSSRFCSSLMEKMKERSSLLLQNKIVSAGIFVEPQFRRTLNSEQLSFAKEAFVDIALHIEEQRLRQRLTDEEEERPSTSSQSLPSSNEFIDSNITSNSNESEILTGDEVILRIMQSRHEEGRRSDGEMILHQLRRYKVVITECIEEMDMFAPTSSLIESLWQYPKEARKATLIVAALPTSQVSVERLFSAFKLLYHALNNSLGPEVITAITFLRWNGC